VPAKFVGHPLFDEPLDHEMVQKRMEKMLAGLGVLHASALDASGPGTGPASAPKLALMPGSRPKEMSSCFPILLDAYNRLKKDFPNTTGIVAATNPEAVRALQKLAAEHGGWPGGLGIVHGETDAVVKWCDYALVVSGTVTLQIARQHKLMVAVYSPSWIVYNLIGRWLVSTELFTLPNLIAGRQIVPERIPHWGDGEALAVEVIKLMRRPGYADDQRKSLEAVCRRFAGKHCAVNAADEIEKMVGLRK
jgi:lipid-A-disaccharide synthase